jgi:hypothetical protein
MLKLSTINALIDLLKLYKTTDELSKAGNRPNPRLIEALLRNSKKIHDPKATEEEKRLAEANLKAIGETGKELKLKPSSEKNNKMLQAVGATKPLLTEKINQKINSNVNAIDDAAAKVKKEAVDANASKREKEKAYARINGRGSWHSLGIDPSVWDTFSKEIKDHFDKQEEINHPTKKQKREAWNLDNKVLDGSEHTRKELQIAAAKAAGETKPKEIKLKDQTSLQQAKVAGNKIKSDISGVLNHVNDLHENGLHDAAFNVINSIPKESLPQNMKGYSPAYIHYGVPPNHWASLPQDKRDELHGIHNDVMSGKHDNNPKMQDIIGKVKPLPKLPPSS